MLFTARPDGSLGFEEAYGYETDVLTAWDGTEQRVLLRELPTRTLRFSALLTDSLEVADVMGRLFANGVQPFSVPLSARRHAARLAREPRRHADRRDDNRPRLRRRVPRPCSGRTSGPTRPW
jgi:hypothetical protein